MYLLVVLLTVLTLHFLLPVAKIIPSPWNLFGVIFLIAGLVSNFQADGLFRHVGMKVQPGEGSSALITHGIFRFSRNPLYSASL